MKRRTITRAAVVSGAALLALSLGTSALADTEGSQTLTTTVPGPPTWTLNIPANTEIDFEAEESYIGAVTVSDVSGLGRDQQIVLDISHTAFLRYWDDVEIPSTLVMSSWRGDEQIRDRVPLGDTSQNVVYSGMSPGTYGTDELYVLVDAADWAAAEGGSYRMAVLYSAGLAEIPQVN